MGRAKEHKAEHGGEVTKKEELAPPKKLDEHAPKKKGPKPKDVRISQKELEELKEKATLADEYFDRLVRLQADFENFRKRKEKERLDFIKFATEGLVCELVPILSDFERALAAAEKTPQAKAFADGVEIIFKQFKKALKEHGMEEICPVNAPFDPYRHEAVERVMTDEHPEGHVVEVFQTGYALNERVLQPAAVKVAVPQASESKPEGEGSSSPGAEVKPGAPEETETEKQASQDQREE